MINGVDGFIFQTERVSYCYPSLLRRKAEIIPNGLFRETLSEVVPYEQRDLKKIVSVGRLTEQKGHDVTICALARLLQVIPDVELSIYGIGPCEQNLRKLAEELKITEHVHFCGNIPNVLGVIKNAGMFVMSSRFEGMPNALMEAMACGLPCICSDCDFGPGELIYDHENGIRVPVEDVDALAMAMQELMENPSLLQKIGKCAENIRTEFSGERVAAMYHSYIKKIVEM